MADEVVLANVIGYPALTEKLLEEIFRILKDGGHLRVIELYTPMTAKPYFGMLTKKFKLINEINIGNLQEFNEDPDWNLLENEKNMRNYNAFIWIFEKLPEKHDEEQN